MKMLKFLGFNLAIGMILDRQVHEFFEIITFVRAHIPIDMYIDMYGI